MSPKVWYQSKTVWAAILSFLLNVYHLSIPLAHTFGVTLPDVPPILIVVLNSALGGMIVYGRSTAMGPLTMTSKTLILVFFGFLVATNSYADIFSPIGQVQTEKVSQAYAIPGVDPNTILAEAAIITSYLGVREGALYDFGKHEFCNYAAATIVTYAPFGISLDFGVVNTDGLAETIDWNVGAVIPSQNVPLLNLFQYLYVGGGLAERSFDGEWEVSAVADAQFKFVI